jgi:hypothetical protein
LECSLANNFCPKKATPMTPIPPKLISSQSHFLREFRCRKRARAKNSRPKKAIAALDQVERTNSQNAIEKNICFFRDFLLRKPSAKTGKKAINQNQKLIGLSKRN